MPKQPPRKARLRATTLPYQVRPSLFAGAQNQSFNAGAGANATSTWSHNPIKGLASIGSFMGSIVSPAGVGIYRQFKEDLGGGGQDAQQQQQQQQAQGGPLTGLAGITGKMLAAAAAPSPPKEPTLAEQAIAAAKSGKLNTADAVYEAAKAQAARNMANAEQHIADQHGWGNAAVGQISGAGRTNAAQNRSYMNQMTGNATKMLKAAGVGGSPIGKLGGINAAEMAANAQTDTGWFNRQSSEQGKLNAFYDNALRRQALAQSAMDVKDARVQRANARNADIQNMISLAQFEQQQQAQQNAGGIDPNTVQAKFFDTLQLTKGNAPAAIGILMKNYNPNNPQQRQARAILESLNKFYQAHPEVPQQLIAPQQ